MPGQVIDVNTASLDELAHISGVGRQRALELMKARPFRSWDEVKRLPGFSNKLIDQMQSAGATVGEQTMGAGGR